MKADNRQLYDALLEVSSTNTKVLSGINTEMMDVFRGIEAPGIAEVIRGMASELQKYDTATSAFGTTLQTVAEHLDGEAPHFSAHLSPSVVEAFEKIRASSAMSEAVKALETPSAMSEAVKALETPSAMSEAVKALQVSSAMSKAVKGIQASSAMSEALNKFQLSTATLLSQMPQTQLVSELSECFEQARYDLMPQTLSRALANGDIIASDIAFLKLSDLVSVMNEDIVYPRGLKTSLGALRKATAVDLVTSSSISYRAEDGLFHCGSASVEPKTLNVISAGKATILDEDGEELFTEGELIDFASFLASTPMMGLAHDVGQRINKWLKDMFEDGDNTVGVDRVSYYHCRKRKSGDAPYTWPLMKKAPYGIPGMGRYNPSGTAHFYFADTQKGAENEIKKYLTKQEVLQTAKIKPTKDLEMLDLSGTLARGKSFLRMIRYQLSDDSQASKLPREYLLPCYVAQCCELIGFDGIKYYGSKEYTNYVTWEDGYFKCLGMC